MSRFVLTAQLQLQAPNNVSQVVRQIQNQLNGVTVNVQVQGAQQAQRQIQQLTRNTNNATTAAERMGRAFAVSIRRFAAFSIATRAVGLFTSTLSDAVQTAIDFERQMIKVSQVTGESIGKLSGLTKTITTLSTGLGVSSQSLLEVSTVLLQAGVSSKDTSVALKTLAKAALAPNFDSLSETAEGAIAILAQFQEGVGSLEKQLGSINAVAGAFAVEAGDLIDVIRRTGGVFKASGGSLNELLALFTSVRATTRESAESIGTGLRTIFTRIQRPKTIEFLKQFGVELVDLEGKFVGPFEAVRRLSEALAGLGEGDLTFIRIAEELGGFRQIGKVLPLLQQFSTAQAALNVAQNAGNSLTKDAETAQAALAIRITKVKEEFLALVRSVTETTTFQVMANTALTLASALIKVADSIKGLLPLFGALAAVRIARGISSFAGGIAGGLTSGRTFNKGGKVLAFARGGMVPGTGNRDTVPAMLSPGEFVIRKSSVAKLGAENLAAMNQNKYAIGGIVGGIGLTPSDESSSGTGKVSIQDIIKALITNSNIPGGISGNKKVFEGVNSSKQAKQIIANIGGFNGTSPATSRQFKAKGQSFKDADLDRQIGDDVELGMKNLISNAAGILGSSIGVAITGSPTASLIKSIGSSDVRGKIFEGALNLLGAPFDPLAAKQDRDAFDFPSGLGPALGSYFKGFEAIPVDAKKNITPDILNDIATRKTKNLIAGQVNLNPQFQALKRAKQFASGGNVGTDTVPALLTPGEFVVNRSSAQRIGYGNLNRMNKVGKYAKGGIVHRFSQGGTAPVISSGPDNLVPFDTLSRQARNLANAQQLLNSQTQSQTQAVAQNTQAQQSQVQTLTQGVAQNKMFLASMATSLIQGFLPAIDENSSALLKLTHYFAGLASTVTAVGFALEAFGVSLNAKQIMQLFGSGPGGIGSIIKNSFSGFKMGASGMAGPMPLGGGMASRVGSLASSARSGLNNFFSPVNRVGRSFSSGFSQGASGMPQARAFFARGSSPFMQNLSIGATKAGGFTGRLANSIGSPIGRSIGNLRAGVGVGMNQGLGATQLVRNIAGAGGISGKIGQGLGALTKIPGVGAIGRIAGGAAAKAGGLAAGAGAFGSAALSMAGPTLAVTGLISIINGAIGAFRDLDGQLQKSIAAGKIEESARLAVAKKASEFPLIGNIVSTIFGKAGDEFLVGIGTIFGGETLSSVKALASSQAGSVKTQKALEQAQKTATNAMDDFANGSITASEALSKIRSATSEVANQEKRSGDFARSNLENRASGGFTARNVASFLTFGAVESSSARNNRLGAESADQIRQAAKQSAEAFQLESAARSETIRSGFARGRSREEISQQAIGTLQDRARQQRMLGIDLQKQGDEAGAQAAFESAKQFDQQIQQVNREIASLEKEVARAKAAFEAMNLGLRGPTATANALSASMNRFAAGLEVGGDMFTANAEFLAEAVSGAAQAMNPDDIKSAVSGVRKNLEDLGISPQNAAKFEANTNAFISAQKNYTQAFQNIRGRIGENAFKGMDADSLKKEFAKELTVGLGDDAKKNLTAIIEGMQLSPGEVDQILSGNLQVFGDKLGEAGRKQFEEIIKISQERQKAEQVLIQLTQKRIDAERNFIDAQKQALDLQLEGREIQGRFGGATVTNAERRANVLAKANVGAGGLGLSNLRSGSPAEFRNRNAEMTRGFAGVEAQRRQEGGMQRAAGVDAAATQQELQSAQKDQIQTIRDLIKIEEDELKIIQEKNRLEKQSLESLITGDIEKFFEQQAAVGATAAIATGNTDLMNQFGASALGAAYADIQRQADAGVQSIYGVRVGGSGGLAEQAAGAALSARGVQSAAAAQSLAGTTPEEEATRARLRGLGGALAETGSVAVDMAQMQLQTAEMNVAQANIILNDVTQRGIAAAQGFNRGGVVYASNGMFVPRGTDTVPAMLTPGEFVVNRRAAQNNLSLLKAINNGSNVSRGRTSYASRGGSIRGGTQYLADGGMAGQSVGLSPELVSSLSNALTKFNTELATNITNLQNTKFQIKLETANININLQGASFLSTLKEQVQKELFSQLASELGNYRVGPDGKLTKSQSVLGS